MMIFERVSVMETSFVFEMLLTLLMLFFGVYCQGASINGGRELTKVQETLLQENRLRVARKLGTMESPLDFLRIFVPGDQISSTFTAMVNETVQATGKRKKKGRFFVHGEPGEVRFDPEMSDQAMAAWIEHSASVGCSEPKLKLIDMFEELRLPRGTGHYLNPSCTLVRRCGGSGCCAIESHECSSVPGTRINVTKPIVKITEAAIDDAGQVFYRSKFLNLTLYEDTACECRRRPDAPEQCARRQCPPKQDFSVAHCACKCKKRCPLPFVQDSQTCLCECAPNDRHCLRIMRGRTALSHHQCQCVDNECEQPKCRRHWHFSRTHCMCAPRSSGSPSGSRQPPPSNRARVLIDAKNVTSTQNLDDLVTEQASGMAPTDGSTGAELFHLTPADEGTVTADLLPPVSDNREVSEEQLPDSYPSYVPVPVAPEQRYGGGEYGEVRQEKETSRKPVTSSVSPSTASYDASSPSGNAFHSRVTAGGGAVETISTVYGISDSTQSTMTSIETLQNRLHSTPGLGDDEDVTATEMGELGSGAMPVDAEA